MYIDRQMQPLLTELQTQFPALLVTGPRQVGKSTLLKHVVIKSFQNRGTVPPLCPPHRDRW